MTWHRVMAIALGICLFDFCLQPGAHAEMISTDAVASGILRDHNTSVLDRTEVTPQLASFGVNSSDVDVRVAALTDEEAARIAREFEELPVGGDGGLMIGSLFLMGVCLAVAFVATFMRILGY
jgi:hypothetical protein